MVRSSATNRARLALITLVLVAAVFVATGAGTAATPNASNNARDRNDASARNIADIVLIDQHVTRYTYLADSHRFHEWAELWTPDGILEEAWQDANGSLHPINGGAGCRLEGRVEIELFITAVFGPNAVVNLPRPAAGLGHRIVNRLIEVDGRDATVSARGPNSAFQYENSLRRTNEGPDGGWKFTRVFIIFDADRTAPCTADGPVLSG